MDALQHACERATTAIAMRAPPHYISTTQMPTSGHLYLVWLSRLWSTYVQNTRQVGEAFLSFPINPSRNPAANPGSPGRRWAKPLPDGNLSACCAGWCQHLLSSNWRMGRRRDWTRVRELAALQTTSFKVEYCLQMHSELL